MFFYSFFTIDVMCKFDIGFSSVACPLLIPSVKISILAGFLLPATLFLTLLITKYVLTQNFLFNFSISGKLASSSSFDVLINTYDV